MDESFSKAHAILLMRDKIDAALGKDLQAILDCTPKAAVKFVTEASRVYAAFIQWDKAMLLLDGVEAHV